MPALAPKQSLVRNHLLATLPREDYERLSPHFKPLTLSAGDIIHDFGEPLRQAWFINHGVVSLLSTTGGQPGVVVGLVGSEALVGLPAILAGKRAPYRATVQLPGAALQIGVEVLDAEFNQGGRLQAFLLRYNQVLIIQLSQAGICYQRHSLEERLSRWLLSICDRVAGNSFQITHECIAQMLGTARTKVTAAAVGLQDQRLISYSRGHIIILSRRGLEAKACPCYGITKEALTQFLSR